MPSPEFPICICQVGQCDDACGVCASLDNPIEPCPYDTGFAAYRPKTSMREKNK